MSRICTTLLVCADKGDAGITDLADAIDGTGARITGTLTMGGPDADLLVASCDRRHESDLLALVRAAMFDEPTKVRTFLLRTGEPGFVSLRLSLGVSAT